MFSLKDFRIGMQIFILLSLCVLLLALTAGIGFFGISGVGNKADTAVRSEGMVSEVAATVTVDSLDLRRYEKDSFLNVAKPEKVASYQKNWEATYTALVGHLDQLGGLLEGTPQYQDAIKMKNGAANYRTGLNQA